MKAVILAAGMGGRLRPLTDTLPKCLAAILQGRTLLDWQLEALRACGIQDLVIVRGYRAEAFRCSGVRFVSNPDYARTNILGSLACARAELQGDVLVSYADLWYEPAVVAGLLAEPGDIVLAVDPSWRARYAGRRDHPVSQAEVVVLNGAQRVVEVGKIASARPQADAEFLGLLKLSPRGCELVQEHYERVAARYRGRTFQRAATFEQAYLTDLLQAMADAGVPLTAHRVQGRWREIDTLEDLETASRELDAGGMRQNAEVRPWARQ